MAEPVLAREYVFAVNTGTDATPTWTTIKGLKEWNAGSDATQADTTDFESLGVDEHQISRRSHTLTLTGQREPGDAGQDAVQAVAMNIGSSAAKSFRVTAPGPGPGNIKTFKASVRAPWLGSGGGGMDDPSSWSPVLGITGAITTT